MLRLFISLCLTISVLPYFRKSDGFRNPVIQIESGFELGTGFLVGHQEDTLYFLTARHVLEDPSEIDIRFYSNDKALGKVFHANDEWDVAVISCLRPKAYEIPPSYSIAKKPPLSQERVITIGHPLGKNWYINRRDEINELEYNFSTNLFTLTPDGIAPGNSGGPVLNQDAELLGMVREEDEFDAICVSMNLLLRMLGEWNVPKNLLVGISTESNPIDNRSELLYENYLDEAKYYFNRGNWDKAENAFIEADKLFPSEDLKAQINTCQIEAKKDQMYDSLLREGIGNSDWEERLDLYIKAQKQRDTEEIQTLINRTTALLNSIEQTKKNSILMEDYKDPLAGEMIFVQGGKFEMGSENGDENEYYVHQVNIKGFYLGKYEVTLAQFKRFIDAGEYKTDADIEGFGYVTNAYGLLEKKPGINWMYNAIGNIRPKDQYDHPVVHISWNDAKAYCEWLSKRTGKNYRLPSEAEWEYAAGMGKQNRNIYSGTNDVSKLYLFGNYSEAGSDKDQFEKIAPVGSFKANVIGLKDLSGNVWEWCEDWYHKSYVEAPDDGSAWISPVGYQRVLRGGSWDIGQDAQRVSYRGYELPDYSSNSIGFRIARTP